MAINAANTYDTNTSIREDLADVIYDISPHDTPFFSMCGKESCDNTYYEWQIDALDPVDTNRAAEGADATFAAPNDTTRLGNYTQINEKTASVTGTQEATKRAGKSGEMRYQIVKRGKELRRSMEHQLVGDHNPYVAGDATPTARETASVAAWMKTNVSLGATGSHAAGTGADVPTVGTARAFTETLLGEVVDSCFAEGAEPSVIMCNAFQKRAINTFAGNTTSGGTAGNVQQTSDAKRVTNAVSVYVSDYGEMKVVPNRWVKTTDVFLFDPEYWKICQLRPMEQYPLAKTGDSEKRQIIVEWGLKCANEAASGAIYSLTTS